MGTTRITFRSVLTLIAAYLGLFVGLIDANAVNLALPAIRDDLGGGISGAQWTIDAYNITFAAVLLTAGSLGDRFGRRRLLRIGLGIFVVASLACAAAPSLPLLLTARSIQGVGAAFMLPQGLAITAAAFPDPIERARATAAWAMAAAMSTAVGPILGGVLTDTVGWRFIFWLNVPVGVLALLMTRVYLPESRDDDAAPVDIGGQALAMLGLGTLTIVLVEGRTLPAGWTAGLGVVAVAALAAFVASQRRAAAPMLPLDLFRSRRLNAALTATFTMTFATYGLLLVNSFAFQQQRGASTMVTALCFLPLPVAYLTVIPFANALANRIGPRLPMTAGLLLIAAGLFLYAAVGAACRHVVTGDVVVAGRSRAGAQHRSRCRPGHVGDAASAHRPGLGRGEPGQVGGYHCRCGGVG